MGELEFCRGDFELASLHFTRGEALLDAASPIRLRRMVKAGLGLTAMTTGDLRTAREMEEQVGLLPDYWYFDPYLLAAFKTRMRWHQRGWAECRSPSQANRGGSTGPPCHELAPPEAGGVKIASEGRHVRGKAGCRGGSRSSQRAWTACPDTGVPSTYNVAIESWGIPIILPRAARDPSASPIVTLSSAVFARSWVSSVACFSNRSEVATTSTIL